MKISLAAGLAALLLPSSPAMSREAIASVSTARAEALKATANCAYDESALTLGFEQFDQDRTNGWRVLSETPGCETHAADLVRRYRQKYEQVIPLLYWHEAQVRASAGQTQDAIGLMEKSKLVDDLAGWNPYADATIAFLRGDRTGLIAARGRLAAWPEPDGWPPKARWPQNLGVVDGLIACFGKTYRVAYGVACRPKASAAIRR